MVDPDSCSPAKPRVGKWILILLCCIAYSSLIACWLPYVSCGAVRFTVIFLSLASLSLFLRRSEPAAAGSETSSGNAEQQHAREEIQTLRHSFEEEKAELERRLQQAQKMESIGLLAGGVAHDFNNKLSVILGNAELSLKKIENSHPVHKHLLEIQAATEMSAGLTRQLLSLARKQRISPRVLNLNEVVGKMLTMLKCVMGEGIELVWMPGTMVWPVKMDPSQVDQVLTNLCVNARDAIKGKGKLVIRTENCPSAAGDRVKSDDGCIGEYVVLTVTDDGDGMDHETIAQIFDPFFTTKAVGRGTGLGLSTVYGIVRQNNGFIDVTSEVGKGTIFRLHLPRYVGKNDDAWERHRTIPLRGSERVLLVEDDERMLHLAKEMLLSLGYDVLEANCPERALRLAKEKGKTIDLLVTDLVMPKMNGEELYVWLKPLCPKLRCLFISGYTAAIISSRSMLEEGAHFLQKPFSLNDLGTKVREALVHAEPAGKLDLRPEMHLLVTGSA